MSALKRLISKKHRLEHELKQTLNASEIDIKEHYSTIYGIFHTLNNEAKNLLLILQGEKDLTYQKNISELKQEIFRNLTNQKTYVAKKLVPELTRICEYEKNRLDGTVLRQIDEFRKLTNKLSYQNYFSSLESDLTSQLTNLKTEIKNLDTALQEEDIDKLTTFFKRINSTLNEIKKILHHYEDSKGSILTIRDKNIKKLKEHHTELKQINNEISSRDYLHDKKRPIKTRIHELTKLTKSIPKKITETKEISNHLLKQFNQKSLLENETFKKSFEEINKLTSTLKQITLNKNLLIEFEKAYESNNQHRIFEILNSTTFSASFDCKVIGTNSGIHAYAGIVPKPHDGTRGWSTHANSNDIPPKEYAKRLADIMKHGVRPSDRILPIHADIFGSKLVKNIFFYTKPHTGYGGDKALISWSVNDYCVLTGFGEFFILTNKSIPPNKLTLTINHPDYTILGYKKYQEEVIKELNRLGIKYDMRKQHHHLTA